MTDYAIYDVFTGTPLAGNPLAVVFDADAIEPARMAAIAREFNLSETVFVMQARQPGHSAAVRIFTPERELPFAGHPTVGAAVAIAERKIAGALSGRDLDIVEVLEEQVGPVRCAVRLIDGRPGFAEFDLPRLPQAVEAELNPADIAAALGIDRHQIGFENHRLSAWSAGVPFVMVPVHDLAAASRIRIDPAAWNEFVPPLDGHAPGAYVYCRGGVNHGASFHARMFAPSMGIGEDPATGAAVAALSGAIHHFDDLRDGHYALLIEQGVEMGRPSHIHLHVDCGGGAIKKARIGGEAVKIAEGRLLI